MSILWCGGEDSDFNMYGSGLQVVTSSSYHRTAYCRCAINAINDPNGYGLTPAFSSVSDLWYSMQMIGGSPNYARRFLSFCDNGAERIALKSLNTTCQVVLTDGTTDTVLGTVAVPTSVTKIDIHIVYGASGSIDIYNAGTNVFSWTGDNRKGGSTTLNGFLIGREQVSITASELIVADEDTRTMSLMTLAPTAAGDANAWTGAYTDISETTINDATELYTNTVTQDAQFNLTDLPSGSFSIKAVMVSARVAKSSGATAGSIGLGVKSGGTINSGSSQSCTTGWSIITRLMATNPVTSAAWAQSDMNALQVNFRSAA